MDIKKVLIITLFAVAILGSVSVVSAGFLDGLLGGEPQDKVIEVDNITFNTTNATDFKENKTTYSDKTNNEYLTTIVYRNDNGTGEYWVSIIDYSAVADIDDADKQVRDGVLGHYKNTPYQTVNGTVVYTSSKTSGEDIGKPLYIASIQNSDIDKLILITTPDINETVKIVSSLKFK